MSVARITTLNFKSKEGADEIEETYKNNKYNVITIVFYYVPVLLYKYRCSFLIILVHVWSRGT